MNTTGMNPAGNELLQAIRGGGLPALEAIAASNDTFPPLKAAVVEALAIIGIVKVCSHFKHSVTSIYATALEIQDQQERMGCIF